MKINVRGKQHLEGIGKQSGKPYNFWRLHYCGSRRNVIGEVAITKTVDPGLFDFEAMPVPGDYLIEYDDQGNVYSISAVSTASPAPKT